MGSARARSQQRRASSTGDARTVTERTREELIDIVKLAIRDYGDLWFQSKSMRGYYLQLSDIEELAERIADELLSGE